MKNRIKLVDTDKYQRDTFSKAIIATDLAGMEAYKARKKKMSELEEYGEEINTLKQEMVDIKCLLQKILENQGKGA